MKLVLFDIDGTIMDSGGAGGRALDLAFLELFGIDEAFRGIPMAGKTDIEIIRSAFVRHNIPVDGKMPFVIEGYLRHLETEIARGEYMPARKLKPGIMEAVLALCGLNEKAALALLTGNIEPGARIKLGAFGLNPYFPFGAFGSDSEVRKDLLPVAAGRFREAHGRDIEFRDCAVIGDTPYDIACAKPYGALSIAVATGPFNEEELGRAGADIVFKDLSDTGAFLETLDLT